MKKLIAFVFMDMYTLKPYLKGTALVAGVGIVLGFALKSVTMPALLILVSLVLITSYPFAIAEKNDMETLYSSLPVKRGYVVAGRYLFALLLMIAGITAAFFLSCIIDAVYSLNVSFGGLGGQFLIFASVLLLLLAFQYPMYFKFGYYKARLAAMVPMLLLSVGAALIDAVSEGLLERAAAVLTTPALLILLPILAAAAFGGSLGFSLWIYKRRMS